MSLIRLKKILLKTAKTILQSVAVHVDYGDSKQKITVTVNLMASNDVIGYFPGRVFPNSLDTVYCILPQYISMDDFWSDVSPPIKLS